MMKTIMLSSPLTWKFCLRLRLISINILWRGSLLFCRKHIVVFELGCLALANPFQGICLTTLLGLDLAHSRSPPSQTFCFSKRNSKRREEIFCTCLWNMFFPLLFLVRQICRDIWKEVVFGGQETISLVVQRFFVDGYELRDKRKYQAALFDWGPQCLSISWTDRPIYYFLELSGSSENTSLQNHGRQKHDLKNYIPIGLTLYSQVYLRVLQ